jgi:hypothetical protein
MAGARDVEGRTIVGLRDGHGMLRVCRQDATILALAFTPWLLGENKPHTPLCAAPESV